MAIVCYFIRAISGYNGYEYLFYWWLLMPISGYFINGH